MEKPFPTLEEYISDSTLRLAKRYGIKPYAIRKAYGVKSKVFEKNIEWFKTIYFKKHFPTHVYESVFEDFKVMSRKVFSQKYSIDYDVAKNCFGTAYIGCSRGAMTPKIYVSRIQRERDAELKAQARRVEEMKSLIIEHEPYWRHEHF